jgi:hypothetical protein
MHLGFSCIDRALFMSRLTTVCTRTLPLRGIAGDTGR